MPTKRDLRKSLGLESDASVEEIFDVIDDAVIRRNQFRGLCESVGIDPETPQSFTSLRDLVLAGKNARSEALLTSESPTNAKLRTALTGIMTRTFGPITVGMTTDDWITKQVATMCDQQATIGDNSLARMLMDELQMWECQASPHPVQENGWILRRMKDMIQEINELRVRVLRANPVNIVNNLRMQPIIGDSISETPMPPRSAALQAEELDDARKWRMEVKCEYHPNNVPLAPSIIDTIIPAIETASADAQGRMIEIALDYGAQYIDDDASLFIISDWHLTRLMLVMAKAENGKELT